MNINRKKAINYLQVYDPRIIVMMPVKNAKNLITQSLLSLANQVNVTRKMLVLIADDNSQDNWENDITIKDIISDNRFVVIKTHFNNVYKNRNFLIEYSKYYAKNLEIMLRLDADDLLSETNIIYTIEKYFFSSAFYFYKPYTRLKLDLLLMGNSLSCNGKKINRINCASNKLKNNKYLLDRLYAMSDGLVEAELPSCNLIWKSDIPVQYPAIKSAEDHFLLTKYLLNHKDYNFYIEEEKLYANYSLSGNITSNNKDSDVYLKSRKFIFNYALNYYGKN